MKKRLWSFFLLFAMLFSVIPIGVSAEETASLAESGYVIGKGTCGSCSWTFDNMTSTLMLLGSGNGRMADYYVETAGVYKTPWAQFCGAIKRVVIGAGVTYVGAHAFANCTNLTDLSFGEDAKEIGWGAFQNTGLKSLTIPSSVETIEESAFRDNALNSVTIQNGVSTIGTYAFRNCRLESVVIPASVKTIEAQAFDQNPDLTRLTLNEGLDYIGELAFFNTGLEDVTIPKSVMTIGPYAFGYQGKYEPAQSIYDINRISSYFVIKGYTNSEAYRYASTSYHLTFISLGTVSGYHITGTVKSGLSETDSTKLEWTKKGGSSPAYTLSLTGNSASYTIRDIVAAQYTLRASKKNHVTREYSVYINKQNLVQDVTVCPVGDITNDGKVNIRDVNAAYNHTTEAVPVTDAYAFKCGDVFKDGKINIRDVNMLYGHVTETNLMY